MAGELLEVRLEAVGLDGTTPITSLSQGQEFLLKGTAKDLRPSGDNEGAFQVYSDIGYISTEALPVISEVQRLDFTGSPTGGTFTLTYNGATTAPILFNQFGGTDFAEDIQTALEGIPALSGNVRVDQDFVTNFNLPDLRYFIRFVNQLDGQDVTSITVDASGLTVDSPGDPAGAEVVEFAKGLRSNVNAFKQAFVYNPRTDGRNIANQLYPDNRQALDATNLFDNVGGGAPLFDPPGSGATTYFLVRMRANNGGADGKLIFTQAASGEQGLEYFLFGLDDALTADQVSFTYGGTAGNRLEIPITTGVGSEPDSYDRLEDSGFAVLSPSPLDNDTQSPSTPRTLKITEVSTGSNGGTLEIIDQGANVRYRPAGNFSGTETFTYTVADDSGKSAIGTITINVTGVNDQPSFTKGADITVNEDASLRTTTNWATQISPGPRESGQAFTFQVTNDNNALFEIQPAISSNGTLTFKPAANRAGTATVSVILRDDGGTANGGDNSSVIQTFVITVRAVNDAPVNTVPDTPQSVNTGNALVFTGATAISVGDIDSGSADLVTTLSVNNGRLSLGGTVGAGLTVAGDNTATITLTGTRSEISNAIATLRYRANAGFTGSDTLTINTNDQGNTGTGGAKIDIDTIDITVLPPAPPTANPDSRTMNEDGGPVTINVLANDEVNTNAQPLLLSVNPPAASVGTVTIDPGPTNSRSDDQIVFTPAQNFSGQATFTYVMNDTAGTGNDSTGTVIVTVRAVNDAPSALADVYGAVEDTDLTVSSANGVLANDGDVEGSPLTAMLVETTSNGTLDLNADGSFSYTPNANFYGRDSFKYRANDGTANSFIRIVSLNVAGRSDRPIAVAKAYTTPEDTLLVVAAEQGLLIGASDADNDAVVRAALVTKPTKGVIIVAEDGSFRYRPNSNQTGQDSFAYRVYDAQGRASLPQTVTINISPVNDRPVAVADSYTTTRGVALEIAASQGVLINDSDIDGDSLTAVLISQPTNGQVVLQSNGSFRYVPNVDFIGTDSFTYRARDNTKPSLTTTVTIRVLGENLAPSATAKAYDGTEDGDITVSAAEGLLKDAVDPEGNSLTPIIVEQPGKGQLISVNSDGSFLYRPDRDANGIDTFTFKVNDGQRDSAVRLVTIRIVAKNDAPPVANDAFAVNTGIADQLLGDVLLNDRLLTNPDGEETITLLNFSATTAQGGTVRLNDNGRFLYTPKAGFTGGDSFTYRVSDGNGGTAAATVNLTVRAVEPSTLSGFVYRDTNENGRRDAGEPGVSGVRVRLVTIATGSVRVVTTSGTGAYAFGGLQPGDYRIVEVQPQYLVDGAEQLGSAGGVRSADHFTISIPLTGLPNQRGVNYNFGEGGVLLGENPNGDPPLKFTLEEILASNTGLGAWIGLSNNQQSWFTTLDSSWANVEALSLSLAANGASLTLTVVVNEQGVRTTYRAIVPRSTQDESALRFRIMATNDAGFQIIRLDGDLDLSEFTRVSSAQDAVFAAW